MGKIWKRALEKSGTIKLLALRPLPSHNSSHPHSFQLCLGHLLSPDCMQCEPLQAGLRQIDLDRRSRIKIRLGSVRLEIVLHPGRSQIERRQIDVIDLHEFLDERYHGFVLSANLPVFLSLISLTSSNPSTRRLCCNSFKIYKSKERPSGQSFLSQNPNFCLINT